MTDNLKLNHNIMKRHILLILPVIIVMIAACGEMDEHYKEFLEGGEKIYPAKADSAKVHPGRHRLQLSWLIMADPKVKRAKVFWNGRNDSTEVEIKKTSAVDTVKVMLNNLAETSYVFEIITYDNQNHASMVTEIVGNAYGDDYERSLLIRPILEATTWKNAATLRFSTPGAEAVATEIEYTDHNGTPQTTSVPVSSLRARIPSFLEGSTFRHRTVFKPNKLAIDSFYTAWQEVTPAIRPEKILYSKGVWLVAGFSSEEPSNSRTAASVIDGNNNTWWIARYTNPGATSYPNHWITIDMKSVHDVDGFMMVQKNGDRKIKVMEIQYSDDNSTWTSLGNFTLANVEKTELYFELPARKSFRYFKIIPVSGHDANQQPGLAEISAFYIE
jgi:hypothetical protein